MTPSARIAAAISVLDAVIGGIPAEQALTNWGRASRYAGSGDRAAVRDHVFAALRCRRSFAALGGLAHGAPETGRALMLGAVRAGGNDPAAFFTGGPHGAEALSQAEQAAAPTLADLPENVALDCPDWLAPRLRESLGQDFAPVMQALRHRAPVFLRVNRLRAVPAAVIAALAAEGISARPHPLAATALEVEGNPRKLATSQAFAEGLFEFQDAASQAVAAMLPLSPGLRVLDYCAGGGGKALAIAAAGSVEVFAHDADPRRMRDLPDRAARAGVIITQVSPEAAGRAAPFDRIILDVPCSGSGSWRRAPEAKWSLTPARLAELVQVQAAILERACSLLAKGGIMTYVTCSLLAEENGQQVAAFLDRHPDWQRREQRCLTPLDGGDGFFAALLARS